MDYVAAARLRNERTPYVLFGEILPNVMGPVMVEFTVRLGYAIFIAAGSPSSASASRRRRPTGACRWPSTTA